MTRPPDAPNQLLLPARRARRAGTANPKNPKLFREKQCLSKPGQSGDGMPILPGEKDNTTSLLEGAKPAAMRVGMKPRR